MNQRFVSVLVLACSFGVVTAACGSDSPGSASTASTPAADTAADTATSPTDAATVPVGSTPTATDPAVAARACPVGRWAFTNAELVKFYEAVGAANGLTFVVEGDAVFELTDTGTFSYQFRDYALSTVIGASATRVVLVGDIGGDYTADDGRFQTSTVEPHVTATATVNGATIDATAILQNAVTQFPFTDAAYICTGANLEVDFQLPGSTTAHVVLPPAP